MSSFHIILNLLYCCLPLEVYPLRSPTWYLSREVGWPPSLPTGPFPQWAPFLPSFCQELAGRNDHCRRPNSIPWSHGNMAATMTSSYLISFCIYFFLCFFKPFCRLERSGFFTCCSNIPVASPPGFPKWTQHPVSFIKNRSRKILNGGIHFISFLARTNALYLK